MSNTKWLDILEQAGDADLGAALMRLARQAEALHRFEAAAQAPADGTGEANGFATRPTVQPHRATVGQAHTEVSP